MEQYEKRNKTTVHEGELYDNDDDDNNNNNDSFHGNDAKFEVTVTNHKRNMREALISARNRPEKTRLLEISKNSASFTKGDPVDILMIEKHLQETGFLSNNWLIHQRRTEGDILYGLLFFPRSISKIVDEETAEILEVELITKICNDAIEYFSMRYGDCLTDDYLISNIYKYLQTTSNTRVKLFAILHMLTFDPALTRFLSEMCGSTGYRKPTDYTRVVETMKSFIHTLTHGTMVDELNINSIVDDMISVAISSYLFRTEHKRDPQALSSIRRR